MARCDTARFGMGGARHEREQPHKEPCHATHVRPLATGHTTTASLHRSLASLFEFEYLPFLVGLGLQFSFHPPQARLCEAVNHDVRMDPSCLYVLLSELYVMDSYRLHELQRFGRQELPHSIVRIFPFGGTAQPGEAA